MKYFVPIFLLTPVLLAQIGINSITYSKVVTLIEFFFIFYSAYKIYKNLFHPNVLFLLSFFVFLLGRILLSFFIGESFAKTEFFTNYIFSDEIQFNMLYSLQIALLGFYLGVFRIMNNRHKIVPIIAKQKPDKAFKYLILFIFWVSSAAKMFVILVFIMQVYTQGYLSLYISPPQLPIVVSLLSSMYFLASAALFTFLDNSDEIGKYKKIFLFILILSLFTGSRGTFVIDLLTYIYFNTRKTVNKVNIVKTVFFAAICMVLLQIVSSTRVGNTGLNFGNLLSYFFWDQGGSIDIQGYTMEYLWYLPKSFLLILKPILDPYLTLLGLNTVLDFENTSTVMTTYSLGHMLSFLVDQGKFEMGYGLGSCYISELYTVGGFTLVFAGSYFYSSFFSFLARKSMNNNITGFLLFMMMPFYIYAPRWNYLGFASNLNYLVKYSFLFIIVYFIIKYLLFNRGIIYEKKDIICDQ
ncbi:O-antigen polysaccharide polymerase Wzy [Oryzomonas japonica]|uniref:O-antigen polysaccharide polymerase Wzy n=1 Tax=Oryzomonas japonica TaxID=2603858 RepID=A0A7J4ZQZ5_9BACT|nr:O-antigen polysaccharide polymerase Wzy [Oryzomonas japonica]KAB0665285.1 O-antigen polysaccharide polymerase Wzy [Oryzomonas japonica]